MVHPQLFQVDGEWHEDVTLRPTLEEFVDLMENLLLKPAPKSFVVWRLLARSWPYILAFAQDDCLEKLRHAMSMSSRACGLGVWLRMAEAAAYQYHCNILEMLQEVPLQDEHLPTVAYCRHQLFNLLLELREQVLQELERGTRTQFISFHWGLGQAGFTCTLSEALKGKVDAIYLAAEENVSFVAEAIDENRFVIRETGWRKALETVCQMRRVSRRWTSGSGTWVTEASLLNVCGEGLQWSWVMSLFHELRAKEGLDEVLFGTTIDANVRSWQMATELLGRMAGSRCQNSQVCFGATVKACESSMQWLAALQMLRQQEHLRMRPSTAALSACIGACRGDWALGIFIARKLQKLNAISATSTLCSMDGASGVWPQALRVYEQTEEADVVTLAATLGICAQGSQPHGANHAANGAWCCAWHLLELAQRQREDLVALSPACTSLTSSASRAKQWRLALESLALGGDSNLISLATAATALTPQQGLMPLLPRLSSCAMDIMERLAGAGNARVTSRKRKQGLAEGASRDGRAA